MVWTEGTIIEQNWEIELDGHKYRITRTIVIQSAKSIAICGIMSFLGNLFTARRRRSWIFEGLYSKTRIGWTGYVLLKNLLLNGRAFHGESTQHKVENCPVWKHRGYWFEHPVKDYKYRF